MQDSQGRLQVASVAHSVELIKVCIKTVLLGDPALPSVADAAMDANMTTCKHEQLSALYMYLLYNSQGKILP